MIYTTEVPRLEEGVRSAVTLGKFDGLHRGHQKLIHRIQKKRSRNCRTVVFTFDVPPRSYMLKTPPKFLLTYEERRELSEERGIDILAECPFTGRADAHGAEDFVKEYLVERLDDLSGSGTVIFALAIIEKEIPSCFRNLGSSMVFRWKS